MDISIKRPSFQRTNTKQEKNSCIENFKEWTVTWLREQLLHHHWGIIQSSHISKDPTTRRSCTQEKLCSTKWWNTSSKKTYLSTSWTFIKWKVAVVMDVLVHTNVAPSFFSKRPTKQTIWMAHPTSVLTEMRLPNILNSMWEGTIKLNSNVAVSRKVKSMSLLKNPLLILWLLSFQFLQSLELLFQVWSEN